MSDDAKELANVNPQSPTSPNAVDVALAEPILEAEPVDSPAAVGSESGTETRGRNAGSEVPDAASPAGIPGSPSTRVSEVVLDEVVSLRERVGELFASVERNTSTLASLARQLAADDNDRREYARQRETLVARLDESRPSFQVQLLRPFVQRLGAMYDLILELRRGEGTPTDTLDLLAQHLRETLSQQGFELIEPAVGSSFDPLRHFVVTTEPTENAEHHERISRLSIAGIAHVGAHDKTGEIRTVVVRPARVVTWKLNSR